MFFHRHWGQFNVDDGEGTNIIIDGNKEETDIFLKEVKSILVPKGIIRRVVPYFDKLINDYSECNEPEKLISIMVSNKLVGSNGDAKRMIKQGAVKINNEKISDIHFEISNGEEMILKVGKRKFLRIIK